MLSNPKVTNDDVRRFWEANPVAAAAIQERPGSAAFFAAFDRLREADECEPYDYSNRIHGYDRASGKRVLDVGCGNGYVLSHYARHGAETAGVDLTEAALELSRERFALAGLSGDFRRTDGDSLPFPDSHFDIACSMGVLHHIENPAPMLREMHRVLKPGGQLILMLYHRASWKYRVVLPLRRHFDPAYRGKSLAEALNMNDGKDCPLAKVYGRDEVRALLRDFTNTQFAVNLLTWKQVFLVPALARGLAPLLPRQSDNLLARRWGWNLYVQADKPAFPSAPNRRPPSGAP
ncbi:MAG: class I SAM-dependent methyltransferase [Alphaproteobacteria bacterium]|nr:class I SAM-dependent methyltransferase [Alphaproteobacteria bacterium]